MSSLCYLGAETQINTEIQKSSSGRLTRITRASVHSRVSVHCILGMASAMHSKAKHQCRRTGRASVHCSLRRSISQCRQSKASLQYTTGQSINAIHHRAEHRFRRAVTYQCNAIFGRVSVQAVQTRRLSAICLHSEGTASSLLTANSCHASSSSISTSSSSPSLAISSFIVYANYTTLYI